MMGRGRMARVVSLLSNFKLLRGSGAEEEVRGMGMSISLAFLDNRASQYKVGEHVAWNSCCMLPALR